MILKRIILSVMNESLNLNTRLPLFVHQCVVKILKFTHRIK